MVTDDQQTIVVIGNGMVGHRFVEKLVDFDQARQYKIVTFCEEPRAAYDRVGLTSFFAHRDAEKLMIARLEWYQEHGIELHLGDRAHKIDRDNQVVYSENGAEIKYDYVVLATGSYPFVPPVEGINKHGVYVYRTIEDLEKIIEHGKTAQTCAVIGGGLLGLEAAKAAFDLGMKTHVIEFAPRLMPRQVDDRGSKLLVQKIEELGVDVHLNKGTKEVLGDGKVEKMIFTDDTDLDVDMIIVSAGIRPRDDVAKEAGIDIGPRGGVSVDDHLRTSDPKIFAIGEVALHSGMIYGLVAPGYEMAEIVAGNLCGQDLKFCGTDLSTKLKLMGVDVASFGNYEASEDVSTSLVVEDPFQGNYKKLLFSKDGKTLLGGILVGDASEYGTLSVFAKSGDPLPCSPSELMGTSGDGGGAAALGGAESMPDSAQICSCNNVTKGQICTAIRDNDLMTPAEVKKCTSAGGGCGGCMPLVTDILTAELAAAGKTLSKDLCEHFAYSRQELFEIVKIKEIKTFDDLLASHGKGEGCEICKPAAASIFASLWNDHILETSHKTLQDTNDRFLANIQRDATYSVVPRVAGGEITPDKLIVLGEVAKKYNLYTKITGGQRVDLFGAKVQDLPDIWSELIDAGFESGHAYGKAVRTVKSCVGSTWCRYGVGDSVGFAIQIENRYRGIRAPHKLKFAVSGCVRECAEAQGKDVGLIATENGYNLYVCGNGGANPRHADLLVADIDEETAVKYMDRFLMYYIMTADKLTRTSVWLEKMEGGLDHIRDVVINDSLNICEELEARMQMLVDTYQCEWKTVVEDPEKRAFFKQFVNTDESELGIEIITERDQQRPADWPESSVNLVELKGLNGETISHDLPAEEDLTWVSMGNEADFPVNGGSAVKYGDVQIAIFRATTHSDWYACQNMCPHKNAFVLSRGIIGDAGGVPKVACPLHKKTFSLESGECLSGEDFKLQTFKVKVEEGTVFVQLPPQETLNASLATKLHCISACDAEKSRQMACVGG
ncbi:nitrite reductase large subunit NirB [Bremerella sp. P1]|uniref:nitrite reductase large subunit NirB n=1 Tax=Bremerella sp. P1 TaxID=3026424 RepID=UPI002368C632|nr:nitrite reductase large subunit NirB [Bremerella sp. P1]WDI42809.1 nitrite reductase large subunit NirB [Bremerella sp. P1]